MVMKLKRDLLNFNFRQHSFYKASTFIMLLSGLIALWMCAVFPPQKALAFGSKSQLTERVDNFTDQGPLVETMVDGHRIIDAMHKRATQLYDYSLVFEITVFKKQIAVKERGKLYFKKPGLMRMEEIGQYKTGSVAVIGKDGRARAHLGGVAKFITLNMAPDDDQLRAVNGDAMKDSDFASLGELLKNLLNHGIQARVSETPVVVKGVDEPTYVLELYRPENRKLVLKRIFVDPNTYLPVRWDDYDFKHPSASVWKNISTNIGLADELFSL